MFAIRLVKSPAKTSNERLIGDDVVALSLFSTPSFLYLLLFGI